MTPRKRGRPAKSSFYHTRWHKVGLNQSRAAEVLGVSAEEIAEFDRIGNAIAERYLLLWDKKHLSGEWSGFIFCRGTLRYKGRQWTPASLKRHHCD